MGLCMSLTVSEKEAKVVAGHGMGQPGSENGAICGLVQRGNGCTESQQCRLFPTVAQLRQLGHDEETPNG